MEAAAAGYDQAVEDELLAGSDWEADGYRLFEVSTLAGSSGRGAGSARSARAAPCSCRPTSGPSWAGSTKRFAMPGGGLVNHDLYVRACARPDTRLVMLLGEGTFHQFHGGAATSGRFEWADMHADYEAIKGAPFEPPSDAPLYIGGVPASALEHLEESVRLALVRRRKALGR